MESTYILITNKNTKNVQSMSWVRKKRVISMIPLFMWQVQFSKVISANTPVHDKIWYHFS
jgi:hypothetical protein